jgi:hypothetical protein
VEKAVSKNKINKNGRLLIVELLIEDYCT